MKRLSMHLWLGLHALTAEEQDQSLVRELRSHKPHSMAKNKVVRYICKYPCIYTYVYICVCRQMYICIYMNIIQSLKTEGNLTISNNTDEPGGHYAK